MCLRGLLNIILSHKRRSAHSSIKCSKEDIKDIEGKKSLPLFSHRENYCWLSAFVKLLGVKLLGVKLLGS